MIDILKAKIAFTSFDNNISFISLYGLTPLHIINPLWAGERQKRFPDNKVILFSKRMFASLIFFSHLYNYFVIDHIFMYVSLQHEIKFPSSS